MRGKSTLDSYDTGAVGGIDSHSFKGRNEWGTRLGRGFSLSSLTTDNRPLTTALCHPQRGLQSASSDLLSQTVNPRVQGVCDRHQHTGARLSHRCLYRPRRDSAGRVVLLSAQPGADGRIVTVALPMKKKHRAARRCFIQSSRQTHFRPVTSLTINVKITAPITATMMV